MINNPPIKFHPMGGLKEIKSELDLRSLKFEEFAETLASKGF